MDNQSTKSRFSKNYSLTYPRIVAFGFIVIIAAGTALLMLPVSVKTGTISFIDALFTATSATCVTGLVVFDTFSKWTLFGQLVILAMIQVGGLGFITILSSVTHIIKRRISLKEKMLLKESVGSIYIGGVIKLGKTVLLGTLIFESLGAIILCTRFIPMMGFKNGLYTSVFMSISAFCNAGFDVLGRISPSTSLININNDPVIMITLSLLIIIGGIGFIVWDDVIKNKAKFKAYMMHTKLVIVTTAVLLILCALLFTLFEHNHTFDGMSAGTTAINALMATATPRTAGFNSVPVGEMTNLSKMLTMVLMFIGGSSGSTAGGVKTTTIAVLVLCVISTISNKNEVSCFGRRIEFDSLRKAIAIISINACEVFLGTTIICMIQPDFKVLDVLFECFSALGTVGMTTGITPMLNNASQLIIAYLMFAGRLTSLVFALMFLSNRAKAISQKPKGKLIIG